MKLKVADNFAVDADSILTSRTCVISQSGGGKSYGIAVICEELCKNKLGFAVIDPEGEYSGLKEKYDVLWLGNNKNADAGFENSDIENIAKVVVDSGFPVIADVSDETDEIASVKKFCEALYNACDTLRKPYLLVIEEADKYSPNKGKQLAIIEEIARRGRKRGLGMIIASQRPAFVNKNILSQCNNQFLGKLSIKNDIDAVSIFFPKTNDAKLLTKLVQQFYVLGDISAEGATIKFRKRETTHGGFTPKLGEIKTSALKDVLKKIGVKEEQAKQKKEQAGVECVAKIMDEKEVKASAEKMLKRKFIFAGERTETISGIKLALKPVILLYVNIVKKGLTGKKIVDINTAFDLTNSSPVIFRGNSISFLKPVDYFFKTDFSEMKILKLLEKKDMTIPELSESTGISDEVLRTSIKNLENKKLVSPAGKKSRAVVYCSLAREKVNDDLDYYATGLSFNNPEKIPEKHEVMEQKFSGQNFRNFLKSIENRAEVVDSRIVYLPYYRITIAGKKQRTVTLQAWDGKEAKK